MILIGLWENYSNLFKSLFILRLCGLYYVENTCKEIGSFYTWFTCLGNVSIPCYTFVLG